VNCHYLNPIFTLVKYIAGNMESIMKNAVTKHLTTSLIIAVTGLFITADLAAAQQLTEEIVVRTKIERNDTTTRLGGGAATEVIELNRYVSFADLDLGNQADEDKLDARIEAVANESCKKLSEMFPLDRSDMIEMDLCVKRAIAGANELKEIAIAAGP
jgi:UrcA family protein